MSLPKDPRQLMMTLMYLVLTAMLAMNVSAEVVQAFYHLDEIRFRHPQKNMRFFAIFIRVR